jgi:hypothetical protein
MIMSKLFSKGSVARAEALLKTIVDAWKVDAEGRLTTTNHGVLFLEGVLIQSMQATSGLDVAELEHCARKSIRDVIRERLPKVARVEEVFRDHVRTLKATPKNDYRLVTRCHFKLKEGQSFDVVVGDAKATFSDQRPDFDFAEFYAGGVGRVKLDRHAPGAYAVIPVRARTPEFALEIGAQHMDLTFGALNYALHFGGLSFMREGGRPIALAFPGAELGLYFPDGKKCEDHALYYTVTPSRVYSTHQDIPARWERVRNSIWEGRGEELSYYETFWRLYFQCLSESDADSRAAKLWKIAEFLTHPGGCAVRADEVCARMAVPFADREIVEYVFQALMKRRNWAAHNASYGIRREEVFEVARNLVELFVWRSAAAAHFPKLADWQAFLKLGQGVFEPKQLEIAAEAMRRRSEAVMAAKEQDQND